MLKTKWRKKYERAMALVEFWKRYHEEQIEQFPDSHMVEIYTAQKIALDDVLNAMKQIAES